MATAIDKRAPQWRKLAISALAGAALGTVGLLLLVPLYRRGALGEVGASEMIAVITGALYVLLGLRLGVAMALPALWARGLSAEDAEDLRDQRRMLSYTAAVTTAWGATLIVLALAGPGGIVPPSVALAVALPLFVASFLLTIAQWRQMDELMRGMSQECCVLSFYLVLIVGGGWAMLARLDVANALAPLDWLTMFFGFSLVAALLVVGRRGLLRLS